MTSKTRRFRELIEAEQIVVLPGVYDGFSARLAQQMGFNQVRGDVRRRTEPLSVNMGFGIRSRPTTPSLSAREQQDLGVAVVSYPRLMTEAAIQGMKNALTVLQQAMTEGRVIERSDLAVSFQEANDLVGFETIRGLEQRFLTAAQKEAKYGPVR